jgi:hypothetical protein
MEASKNAYESLAMEGLGLRGVLISVLKVYGLSDETRARIVFNVEKSSRECGGKLQGQQELEEMVQFLSSFFLIPVTFGAEGSIPHTKFEICGHSDCENSGSFCSSISFTFQELDQRVERKATSRNCISVK